MRSAPVLGPAALAVLAAGLAAHAQKGGGTPPLPAPGTIYFSGWRATSGNGGDCAPMTMNGGGTDKRSAFSTSGPSYQWHGGSR